MLITTIQISCVLLQDGEKKTVWYSIACKGEAICNDKLVNYFKVKEHRNCSCSTV